MDELLGFIQNARLAGATNDQITAALTERGWQSDQIQAAFSQLDAQVPAAPVEQPIQPLPLSNWAPEEPVTPLVSQTPEPYYSAPVQDMPSVAPSPSDISSFAVPSQDIVNDSGFTIPPLQPALPDLELPQNTKDVVPAYVNESAMIVPKKRNNKAIMAAACMLLVLGGFGFAYWKGLLPTFKRTQVATTAFAQFQPIRKDSPISLNDSVRFTITGSQLMTSEEFNSLQEDSDGIQASGDNQVLLVYYTVQNSGETAQVLSSSEGDSQTFTIVDEAQKRVDIPSGIFTDSLATLSELKPKQYTSNALLFEIPTTVHDLHSLYFMLQSTDAQPTKGYLKL